MQPVMQYIPTEFVPSKNRWYELNRKNIRLFVVGFLRGGIGARVHEIVSALW